MSDFINYIKTYKQVEKSVIKEKTKNAKKQLDKNDMLIKPTKKYTKEEQETIINRIFGTYEEK